MKPHAAFPCLLRRLLLLAVPAGALLGGCSDSGQPLRALVEIPAPATPIFSPSPTSPEETIRLLEWCYDHEDLDRYSDLFTEDYRFELTAADTNGNAYRDLPFTREDDLISTRNLFLGGNENQPAARSIRVVLDEHLVVLPITRPGHDPTVHKTVATSASLSAMLADGSQIEIRGQLEFLVVRGDSALIPPDLLERGFHPDSAGWFIERWEDRTPGEHQQSAPPGRTTPATAHTWTALKLRYR